MYISCVSLNMCTAYWQQQAHQSDFRHYQSCEFWLKMLAGIRAGRKTVAVSLTVSQEFWLQYIKWTEVQRADCEGTNQRNDVQPGHSCSPLSCLPPTRGCLSAVQIWCHWWDQTKCPGAAETRSREWDNPNCCSELWSGMFGCKVCMSTHM